MIALEPQTRIQLKNILFATDFSRASEEALPYAVELARHFGGTVHALHVRPPEPYPMVPPSSWTDLAEVVDAQARERMKNLFTPFPEIAYDVMVIQGELWPAIESEIERNQVDLVVIGTRGRTGLGKLLLGSVAEEILRVARCPVLTVGPLSLSAPPSGGQISEILFATDFSQESLAAVPYAISLAQEYQAHLTLLHVIEKPQAGDFVRPSELEGATIRRLQALVPPGANLWCEPWSMVTQGVPAEEILAIAAERGADLVVLGVRRPTGVPGASTHLPIATAHKVVSHAKCPVLTVRG
jgi:nucleotide-binding universal stress UspA family protein